MALFEPCRKDLFFKSTKAGDSRLGEGVSQDAPAGGPAYTIAGYPDDEGIRINGGRTGAAQAPDMIRKYFYKMTPSPWAATEAKLHDLGNLITSVPLAERHEKLKKEIAKVLAKDARHIGLGGGHDYGYPDGAAFLLSQKNSKHKPLVINFDAHLDVRPVDDGLSSGTPFHRLLTDKELPAFDFVEIGLQGQCNSPAHYNWAREKGVMLLNLDDLYMHGNFIETTLEQLGPALMQGRPAYISVDIDAFASAYAPGCSQSWGTGLIPNDFMALFQVLIKRLDVRVLGIYEVSPPLDIDDRTSKLAAQIMHRFVHSSI